MFITLRKWRALAFSIRYSTSLISYQLFGQLEEKEKTEKLKGAQKKKDIICKSKH